jgi:hypothetical protein
MFRDGGQLAGGYGGCSLALAEWSSKIRVTGKTGSSGFSGLFGVSRFSDLSD